MTRLVAALAGAIVVLVAGGVVWSAPRAEVPLPGPDATPTQVVRAYLDAVNARDFETANQIDARSGTELRRWSRPGHTSAVDLREVSTGDRRAQVVFTADVEGGDHTVQDGPWGYYLQRGGDGSWRITDAGLT